MSTAISIERLEKRYGDVRALAGIDLKIEEGSIFGLVGPNGSGKTTLIRTLVGALKPDAGSVSVAGVDPVSRRYEARSLLGYMPQSSVLYSDLTAGENIAFFCKGHSKDGADEAAAAALDFVDLIDSSDRLTHTLSGGVQQRVSLAAAMAHQPRILLLDEPTAGVDPELRHTFWQGFRRLAEQGVTVFISTHQMDEVVHCDRVALLRRGRVLAEAPPVELLASGGGTIRIHRGVTVEEHDVSSPGEGLAEVLRGFGLDQTITRIDVEVKTLEEVILGLVDGDESAQGD